MEDLSSETMSYKLVKKTDLLEQSFRNGIWSLDMLNNTQLMEEWEKDSRFDRTNLMHTMYSHPMLHSKYLTLLQDYKLKLRKHAMKYAKLKQTKIRYYSGEMTKEQLEEQGWQQYLFKKPLKSEMEALLDADADLQLLQEESLYVETLVTATEAIMKDISNRYYLFKNLVEYEKFQAGG